MATTRMYSHFCSKRGSVRMGEGDRGGCACKKRDMPGDIALTEGIGSRERRGGGGGSGGCACKKRDMPGDITLTEGMGSRERRGGGRGGGGGWACKQRDIVHL